MESKEKPVTGDSGTVLKKAEAAKYLKVSLGTLDKFLFTQGLPHFKAGKKYLFLTQAIDQWLSDNMQIAKQKGGDCHA